MKTIDGHQIIDVCDWETVEKLTRKGEMADLVIDQIHKHMWSTQSGLKPKVFLAFGGGSIIFDSPLPGILRLNTYCQDEDAKTGIGGGEHIRPVQAERELEDAVWMLLSDAFDDLCDIDEYCTDSEFMQHVIAGDIIPFIAEAFRDCPANTVFLQMWFGESVSACWLGEGVIYITSEDDDEDGLFCEKKTTDSPEDIAKAIFTCYRDYHKRHQRKIIAS